MHAKNFVLEELLAKIDDLERTLEERAAEGEDLSLAIELVSELREDIEYRLD